LHWRNAGLGNKVPEVERPSGLGFERPDHLRDEVAKIVQACPDVRKYVLPSNPFQLDAAAGRQIREFELNLLVNAPPLSAQQGGELSGLGSR